MSGDSCASAGGQLLNHAKARRTRSVDVGQQHVHAEARSVLRAVAALGCVLVAACTDATPETGSGSVVDSATPADVRTAQWGLGRAPSAAEIAAVDIDVGPGGDALPAGRGSVAEGAPLYAAQCAGCHGAKGEGLAKFPPLIGRDPKGEDFGFGKDPALVRTIGNYWPYAYTLFDYIRKSMPHGGAGRLSDSETYAVTAWLLAQNQVIADTTTLDAASLRAVKMPAEKRFVPDNRKGGPEVR
ncbi:MAG: c-type cytochrome [Gemmatimonadetes bacterium]|nr:c-type cytochrome [Gemmatimonadota bacterium]